MVRPLPIITAAAASLALLAGSAHAASVAYVDGYNVWVSSPDGAQKTQLTTGGTQDASWNSPVQGLDGKTIAVHRDTINGSTRPVLYLYGADGRLVTANVMPVYSGATAPVYPIGLDMDWSSQAVAYGYSYCGFACRTTYRGYWLTFSDQQGAYPSNPQGASDAYFPTFYGKRVVSSDSGGRIFVQPDVAEAPFTASYQGWLSADSLYLRRAVVAPAGSQMAVEWSKKEGAGGGITVGQHGAIPGDVTNLCDLPVNGDSSSMSFSPDGSQIAWQDADGVKVAGAPNLAAGTTTCSLTAPVKIISATGKMPRFGGGDVATIRSGAAASDAASGAGAGAGGPAPGAGTPPAPKTTVVAPKTTDDGAAKVDALELKLSGRATRTAFKRGLVVEVAATGAGRLDASASIDDKTARKLKLKGTGKATTRALAGATGVRGLAASASVVVARGSAKAGKAGKVRVTLKPTRAAKRAAKRMKGITLSVRVSQGAATGATKVSLR